MSHEFDENLDNQTERRSRKNPRLGGSTEREIWERRQAAKSQESVDDLRVFDDPSVHPIPKPVRPVQASAQTVPPNQNAARQTTAHQTAVRQTAVTLGSGGYSPHTDELAERRHKRRLIAMIIAECLVLLFIFGYAGFAKKWNMIQRPEFAIENVKNNDLDVSTVEKMKGYWTIAVFGVDARDRAIAKGTNADVNMICNINQDTGEIKLVSVFRDTYLNISEGGSYNKMNQAYFVGGPEQAVATLNRNLDLNISDYMTFNWKAVADAINILGGVDIELSKAEFYYINSFITETVKVTGIGSNHLKKAGMNHLDGVQAVAYGRLRLMDTDFARTERQRKVITQAFEKAKKADFATLNTVIGTVFPNVASSVGVDDLVMNAKNISKYHIGETTGFPQARGDANMGKKGAVVVPQTLETNVKQLHTFLFGEDDYTPSATVKKLSSKIAADSGMYKEGKYVDKVPTEGGAIQPPKTTAAPKEDEEETEEEETTSKTKPGSTTEVETDENGDPIEETVRPGENRPGSTTEVSTVRPGGTTESTSARPGGGTTESTTARPGGNTPESSASRPGGSTPESSASRPGGGTPESSASRPGGGTTESSPARPGGSTNESTVSRPGEGNETTGSGPRPGGTEPTTAVPQFPGSSSGSPGGNAPGSSGSGTTSGAVAAPGM